jgi:hypothetical protein
MTKTTTITLRNDFHNTSARVHSGPISARTANRVRRELCGMSDCSCSGTLGTRGPQDAEIVPTYDAANPYTVTTEAR